eukprot:c34379_g1_i1 orf=590-2407(-)
MTLRQLCLILLHAFLLQAMYNDALTPDGEALLTFKEGMKNSDGVLSHWKEEDSDPCGWPGVTCDAQTKRVVFLNLPFHSLWGTIAPGIGKLDQLQRLGLHQNSLFGNIPADLGNCSQLRALYLQDNFLSGSIPSELGKLSKLRVLDISSNLLSGTIPPSLGNLYKLSNFNASTNFLVGAIPENGVLKNFTGDSFVGNLGLCGQQINEICKSQLEEPVTSPGSSFSSPREGISGTFRGGVHHRSSKYSSGLLISALGTVGILLLVALMCFWGCFLYHKFWKKPKLLPDLSSANGAKVVIYHGDLPYTSKEILRKIELLSETNIIGYGGFGTVYKLAMDDGSMFALKKIGKNSLRSDLLFERELEVLGSIKHRNLVNIRGYCNAPAAKLLIYDYLPNGSLDEFLHERDPYESSLNWRARLKIAVGAARGLAYLHHDCSPRIIHRDIKSSNILLAEDLEPHVSDFGLAKLLEDNDSHVTTIVAGTFGYLAPEYLQSGRATAKADVYSYGVVLLELISGKRPNDASFVEKGLNIVGWANSLIREKSLKNILDSRCEGTPIESLEAVLHVTTLCIAANPLDRPTMHQVVKMLEAEIMSPCASDFYDSASD